MPTVTVVPSDSLIIVDGKALVFPFDAPTNLHALQWRGDTGHDELLAAVEAAETVEAVQAVVVDYDV